MNSLPPPLRQIDGGYVSFRRRKFSYFGGCDYFRLSRHPAVLRAAKEGLELGLNVAASRATTGNHPLYEQLENELAGYFGCETALLVANGYATNLVVTQALAGDFSHALLDERAHPSLADAARFLDCSIARFRHRDVADLDRVLRRLGPGVRLVLLTDGMFSHDGSVAPLNAYLDILPKDALVLLDDAHGAGVLGESGRGTVEYTGAHRRRVIQTMTLSKAFGVYGGAILTTRLRREKIISRSRLFVGSTPLPLPWASAARRAVKILKSGRAFRRRLSANTKYVKAALAAAGLSNQATPGPIVSIVPRDPREARALQRRLLARKILPTLIRYPGGPPSGYFRFAVSSEHTRAQLDHLVGALIGR
jgi:7-keto-8-aminopelargonate synthetase-like enzyme